MEVKLFLLISLIIIANTSSPLTINLYYESMCPYCSQFITTSINEFYNEKKFTNVVINLIPYGLAEESSNLFKGGYTYKCHHGENECLGNAVHACIEDIVGRINSYQFIICIENMVKKTKGDFLKASEMCLRDFDGLYQQVSECAQGKRGSELLHKNRLRTPSINYVPYITVNGWHNEQYESDIRKNIIEFLCRYEKEFCT